MTELHRAQRFTVRRIRRDQIKAAPYNPRDVDPESKRRLAANLDPEGGVGLVMPLVWNETTGHALAGHLRLKLLDKQHGGKDYELVTAAGA